MKKRLLLLFSFVFYAAFASAQTADGLEAGRDYILLDPPQNVRAEADKIELLEFFNFSCPHCFRLQGEVAKWKKDAILDDVAWTFQPVVFNSSKGHYARMFHTLESLGITEEYYDKLFNAIHRERKLLNSESRFADWLTDEKQDGEKAKLIYSSFTVNAKVRRDDIIADSYGVNSTPQIAVAGKYLVSTRLAGSMKGMLEIVGKLIERERATLPE